MNHTIEFKGSAADTRFLLEIANVLMSENCRLAALIRSGAPIRYMSGGAAVTSLNMPIAGGLRQIKRRAR